MPFGEYKDFDDCVSQNKDKDNPEGYCAVIHKNITGDWPSDKKYRKDGMISPALKKKESPKQKLDKLLRRRPDLVDRLPEMVSRLKLNMNKYKKIANNIREKLN